ncbi:MAG: hypothetical protein NWE93_06395 [Candidatus Bathyarchaeota archaeon]|nr:hypothetical protein [Candidatus Bathyarchaeota archaeon]
MGRAWILCKKLFSITLVFNALVTIACCIGVLAGYYYFYRGWQPYAPFLANGNLIWVAIIAAAINVFPSALVGRKLHTGRFLFHHYFYGILVMACAVAFVVFFTSESLLTIFLVNSTDVAVNVGRFFLLAGLALLLDDLPDANKRLEAGLNWLKAKVLRAEKTIVAAQLISGAVSLYLCVAVLLAGIAFPAEFTVANCLLIGTVFVTGITSFIFVKQKVWHKAAAEC